MKRIMTILLAAALLLSLAGCTRSGGEEQIAFYYRWDKLSYGEQGGVIAAEYRDLDAQKTALVDILNQYVDGPKVTALENVFPLGCEVLSASREGDVATVHFNEMFAQLEGISQTLACVCMSRTVMELTGAKRVRISAEGVELGGNNYLEFDEKSVLYFDDSQ